MIIIYDMNVIQTTLDINFQDNQLFYKLQISLIIY